jgi:hypothetical protein
MDRPRSFLLYVDGTKGSSKRGEYRFAYRLEPMAHGTRVVMNGTIEGMGVMGALLGFLMKGMFRKAMQKDMDALKAHVEGGVAAVR